MVKFSTIVAPAQTYVHQAAQHSTAQRNRHSTDAPWPDRHQTGLRTVSYAHDVKLQNSVIAKAETQQPGPTSALRCMTTKVPRTEAPEINISMSGSPAACKSATACANLAFTSSSLLGLLAMLEMTPILLPCILHALVSLLSVLTQLLKNLRPSHCLWTPDRLKRVIANTTFVCCTPCTAFRKQAPKSAVPVRCLCAWKRWAYLGLRLRLSHVSHSIQLNALKTTEWHCLVVSDAASMPAAVLSCCDATGKVRCFTACQAGSKYASAALQ